MSAMSHRVMEKLLAIIEARGLSDAHVARTAFGVPKENFGMWKSRGLPAKWQPAAAKFIGCTIDDLVNLSAAELVRREKPGYKPNLKRNMVHSDQRFSVPAGRIPVVGTAQIEETGTWKLVIHQEGGDGFVELASPDAGAYALRIQTDQLEPWVRAGGFVLCAPNFPYASGDDVLVRLIDGESMFKRFMWERDGLVALESVNSAGERISIARDRIEYIHLVSGTVSKIHWTRE